MEPEIKRYTIVDGNGIESEVDIDESLYSFYAPINSDYMFPLMNGKYELLILNGTDRENVIDLSLLEFCVREDLNKKALRTMAVLDPIKLIIDNYPENQTEMLTAVNNPEDEAAGTRQIPFSKYLWIERADFMENPPKNFFRLAIGKEVRLKYAYIVECVSVDKDENGVGEIEAKGPNVMMGYYKDPERTEKVLKDGWFNTEDFGRFNKKGQLLINGRKKNVIVLNNGKNIYPEEIENYILKIPYVLEGIVKAVKNDKGQEISLCAEVFLNKEKLEELGIENPEEELKKDIAKETKELPVYKKITKIEIREEEFVKTTTKKIKR